MKKGSSNVSYEGLISRIRRLWIDRAEPPKQKQIVEFVARISTRSTCPDCGGTRLNEAARTATVAGLTIAECTAMQLSDLHRFIADIDAPEIAPSLLNLEGSLSSLMEVGLGYLSLDRPASTLSGGEAQRVKMVRHLGSPLSDLTYVFDEPTIGLHPHDIARMNELLLKIRDKGNTVLVVEHKPEVIAIADHVVDIGLGSGNQGGTVVYTGSPEGLKDTLTGQHLHTGLKLREASRTPKHWLEVGPVTANNLEGVSTRIPLETLTVITGVAGSGKSTLIRAGLEKHPDVVVVDQSPIRGSRRSNPATFTGLLDKIRARFAKENGVKASLFSANSEGACPGCNGLGVIYTDLAIMAGVATPCEECGGRRFRAEILEYTVAGYNISQVLEMSVRTALAVFGSGEAGKILRRLVDVGLPYLRLGQPLSTLSGGERQRLKLAAQLSNAAPIIVLDEPTAGLHLADTDVIITMLHSMVEAGKTVIVIEHNLAVMAAADWIIDLGPGAGSDGGRIVFSGTPAQLVSADTLTGAHLKAATSD